MNAEELWAEYLETLQSIGLWVVMNGHVDGMDPAMAKRAVRLMSEHDCACERIAS